VVAFVFLSVYLEIPATKVALAAIALTIVFRVLTIAFNWRTTSVASPS